MAEICVVYLSEDETVVEQLVLLLRASWDVWWAKDIAHGDWEEAVRAEIPKAKVLIPVLSGYAKGKRKHILKDEMRYADELDVAILPFLIGQAEIPFGFGDLNYAASSGWTGDPEDDGFLDLKSKIAVTIGNGGGGSATSVRPRSITVRTKLLHLPAFVFSLSSHETQVMPKEGIVLLNGLLPGPVLVSAYDVWRHYESDRTFVAGVNRFKQSEDVLFLDSGNYEASRKSDHRAADNVDGWHKKAFRTTAMRLSPDLVFAYDKYPLIGEADCDVERIVKEFCFDDRAMHGRDFPLCPIIHLTRQPTNGLSEFAARVVASVAKELDPLMLAIPERELGDGLMQRVRTVRDIRNALNELGKYYPIHLLGTGNPITIVALAAAGADSFDGLEWCRTVADYDTGCLFHFQQFELFQNSRLRRVQDPKVRSLIEANDASYALKTLSYNADFFRDWTKTMRAMIHSGQTENLLRAVVPDIGRDIFEEITK
jgi:queuine/archaeosine tRNA-ribosyltransferase